MVRIGDAAAAHYERLAGDYDENWSHSAPFLDWMTREMINALCLTPDDRIADVGCGTGLFTARICQAVRPSEQILCVDPSEAMLAQLPAEQGLRPVRVSAELFASGETGTSGVDLAPGSLDAILVKEAIHHVALADRRGVVAGLSGLLSPRGRLLVVMLPTRIEYPLFGAALDRFEALQPDPATIAEYVRDAGLRARLSYRGFPLHIPKDRYLAMVRNRYMSLLSTFDDDDIEAGAVEIGERYPEGVLSFRDRFAFVLGERRGS